MRELLSEMRRRRLLATLSIYVVAAWGLMQIADVLFPGWGIPEENIRYVLYAAIACFPIAAIVGWKYDITARGIRRTPSITEAQAGEPGSSLHGLDRALLALLAVIAIVVIGFAGRIVISDRGEAITLLPNSLAVLPLANLSEDDDNAYFAAGLSAEMINVLGQIRGFRVTPQASASYFKGRELDLGEVARKLRVASVLTGSVQKAANRIRISVSLIDTAEGFNQWSQTYDRDLTDIFLIQSEIAHAVAEALRVQILGEEENRLASPPTANIEAYDIFMLAQERRGAAQVAMLDKALALDPNFADAHLFRALSHFGWYYLADGPDVETVLNVAAEALERAESLIDDPAETSFLYNWVKGLKLRRELWLGRGNAESEKAMEAAFLRAIELNPSESTPYLSLSIYYRRANRFVDAERMLLAALERDRLYRSAMLQLTRVYSLQGRDQEAIDLAIRVTDLFESGYDVVGKRYAELGRYDKAIEWYMKTPDKAAMSFGSGAIAGELVSAYRAVGDPERAAEWSRFIAERQDSGQPLARGLPEEIAATLRRGQGLAVEAKFDEAFELTNRMVVENGITEWYVLNEPAYYAVHAGRFADAVRLYEIAFPQLRDPLRPDVTNANLPDVLYFAHALQQLGDSGRASVLFGRILDETEQRRPVGMGNVGITEACVYASVGDADGAVAPLREAVDAGWRGLHETYSGYPPPMLAALESDPEYERAIAEIETDLAAQRQNLREQGY